MIANVSYKLSHDEIREALNDYINKLAIRPVSETILNFKVVTDGQIPAIYRAEVQVLP